MNPAPRINVTPDIFKCCKCLKTPEGQIFCCKKGHPMCVNCYANRGPKNNNCPKCKDKLLKNSTRNEYLEEVLDSIQFDCEFSGNGCTDKLPRQMLSIHIKTCHYREQIRHVTTEDLSTSQTTAGTSVVKQETQSSQPEPDFSSTAPEINEEEDCQTDEEEHDDSSLKKQPQPQSRNRKNTVLKMKAEEISSSSDEDEDEIGDEAKTPSENSDEDNIDSDFNSDTPLTGYELRPKKRKINYRGMDAQVDDEDNNKKAKKQNKSCDIFSFSLGQISNRINNPKLMHQLSKVKLVFSNEDEISSSELSTVEKFFSKFGFQFEELVVSMPYYEENFEFLERVLKTVEKLKTLEYHYQQGQDVLQFLTTLKIYKEEGNLPGLNSLKLIGQSGKESLREEHINKLAEVGIQFKSLEIGDSLWEDVTPATIRKLMENCTSSLETLIIHGGFKGKDDITPKILTLTFPRMEILLTLQICQNYGFFSEFQNALPTNGTVVYHHEEEEPFKVTVKFENSFPRLKHLVLGSLIEVEDLYFSTVRKLTTFCCGSYWNLSLQFPPDYSRKSLLLSNVTSFQFPDALKDPSYPEKVARHFPKLTKVHLYLPSAAVLHAFFKVFENSSVKSLYLKTQFDFPFTLEYAFFPRNLQFKVQDANTKRIVEALKKYKFYEQYASFYNIQLPAEENEDVSETNSSGIAGLKKLKLLDLEHISRTLFIPVKGEKLKWYDSRCKFINVTFGFLYYPLAYECDQSIIKLNLVDYITDKIDIHKSADGQVRFVPVREKMRGSAKVKVMTSMLFPEYNVKVKDEAE